MTGRKSYFEECLTQGSEEVFAGQGKNIIPEVPQKSLWERFFEKFKDPIITILLIVLCFSTIVSLYEIHWLGKSMASLIEPVGILAAILLATGIGFLFEVRAGKEFDVLNKVKDERPVKVIRKSAGNHKPRTFEIRRRDVVKGDIVQLESGDEVPADCILLESNFLRVDESVFTGELYADKFVDVPEGWDDTTFPANMLLRGSTVIEGFCICRAIAVGMDSEEGKGAKLMQEEEEVETPLSRQLNQLGSIITKVSYIVAGLIILGRTFLFLTQMPESFNFIDILEYFLHSVMLAVTIIVVAVPEGLPMSVTISLALSMRKMLREKNLVRKLHACETMGATTVICTDKTGTLTENKMRVIHGEFFGDDKLIAASIAANSTANVSEDEEGRLTAVGNPTEGALLIWLQQEKGIPYLPIRETCEVLDRKNFSSVTKFMETTMADPDIADRSLRLLKGAPEVIMDFCTVFPPGCERAQVQTKLQEWQDKAMRTLAFAYQTIEPDGSRSGIYLLGIVGIADPVREDVKAAISICQRRSGVRVIMVTGDVQATANEVGRETGILDENENGLVLTGSQFAEMTDKEVLSILPSLKILSRARPEDKARLVTLLQQAGEVVAVTGDGSNDAPALKKAQVGLSMGDGTARAKEASDITIIDNSFSSINKGILWGRSIYLNIKRFILFQMTINVCACLIVLFGSFIGMDSPLTVTQMLWVNLIMDTFAAMALASLPADPHVMDDKPRDPHSHIIDKKMGFRIFFSGILFSVFLIFLWQFLWYLDVTSFSDLLKKSALPDFIADLRFRHTDDDTMTHYEKGLFFTFFIFMQFWNLFNTRFFRTGRSLLSDIRDFMLHPKDCRKIFGRGFIIIALVILTGQICIVNFLGPAFEVDALRLKDWIQILFITSPVLIVPDIIRTVGMRSDKNT